MSDEKKPVVEITPEQARKRRNKNSHNRLGNLWCRRKLRLLRYLFLDKHLNSKRRLQDLNNSGRQHKAYRYSGSTPQRQATRQNFSRRHQKAATI